MTTNEYKLRLARTQTGEVLFIDTEQDNKEFEIIKEMDVVFPTKGQVIGFDRIPLERGIYAATLVARWWEERNESGVDYESDLEIKDIKPYPELDQRKGRGLRKESEIL